MWKKSGCELGHVKSFSLQAAKAVAMRRSQVFVHHVVETLYPANSWSVWRLECCRAVLIYFLPANYGGILALVARLA